MPSFNHAVPTTLSEDAIDDLLYFARTGDLEQLQADLRTLSNNHHAPPLEIVCAAVDESTGNGLAHYACANGHLEILNFLISLCQNPSTTLSQSTSSISPQNQATSTTNHLTHPNNNLSTPLHYAALNNQLPAVRLLVETVPLGPARSAFVSAKNAAGRDAALEAECASKDEVVTYLLGILDEAELQPAGAGEHMEDGPQSDSSASNGVSLSTGYDVENVAGSFDTMDIQDRNKNVP